MPGWVFTSSRNRPSTPCSSSQRKSLRLVPLQPKQLVGAEGNVLAGLGNLVGDVRRADMIGHAVGILGVEIVEAGLGLEFGDEERPRTIDSRQHRRRQFAAPDKRLGQQFVELLPRADGCRG